MKFLQRLIAENASQFLSGALLGGGLYALVVGGLSFYLVSDQPFWRLLVLSVVVALGVMAAALAAGVRSAAARAIGDWVQATGAGPMLAKVVFKQALGVSDKRPGGSKPIAAELEGATAPQARDRLADHLGSLFADGSLERWLPQQGRWLAKQLIGPAGWEVTQQAIKTVSGGAGDPAQLDLLALRDRVAAGLAEKAAALAAARATMAAAAVTGVAAVVNLLVAWLLAG